MDSRTIRLKFGRNYVADERTFMMGIDQRFTTEIARRFRNRRVLETCTGGGFSTIALAQRASRVITVEINPVHQLQAKQNIVIAQLEDHVTFVLADIMDEKTWSGDKGLGKSWVLKTISTHASHRILGRSPSWPQWTCPQK